MAVDADMLYFKSVCLSVLQHGPKWPATIVDLQGQVGCQPEQRKRNAHCLSVCLCYSMALS